MILTELKGLAAQARFAADLLAYAADVPRDDILTPRRGGPRAAEARQVAMYLLHTAFGLSQAEVALALGRDRSTVAHGLRQVEDRRDDPAFDAWIVQLEEAVRTAPPRGAAVALEAAQ